MTENELANATFPFEAVVNESCPFEGLHNKQVTIHRWWGKQRMAIAYVGRSPFPLLPREIDKVPGTGK